MTNFLISANGHFFSFTPCRLHLSKIDNTDSIRALEPSSMKNWDFNTSFVQCLFSESQVTLQSFIKETGEHIWAPLSGQQVQLISTESARHTHNLSNRLIKINDCALHFTLSAVALIRFYFIHWISPPTAGEFSLTTLIYILHCTTQTLPKKERLFLMTEQTYNLIVRFGGGGPFPSARGQLSGRQLTGIQQYFRPAALMLLFCSSVRGARQIDTFKRREHCSELRTFLMCRPHLGCLSFNRYKLNISRIWLLFYSFSNSSFKFKF